jgi:hypothetical protein
MKERRETSSQFSNKQTPCHIQIVFAIEMILTASEIKAEHAISYAACFAVAPALGVKASIITGDPEFKQLEDEIPAQWIT